jgi:hypothetical protein
LASSYTFRQIEPVCASAAACGVGVIVGTASLVGSAVASGAARLGGGLAVAFLLSSLAARLATRRPVWPWARSLPVASHRRVAEDAAFLAAPCLVPLAAAALLDPWRRVP